MTRRALAPWRAVAGGWGGLAEPELRMGRGSVLGPDTSRRTRWWELRLECGHEVERTVRYGPPTDGTRASRGGTQHRRHEDVLPGPRRVRCELCGVAQRAAESL